jgi:hypothetical protein
MGEDVSVCIRCAKSERKGCCWIDPDQSEQAFGISIADVRRIVKATGKKPSEFLVVEKVDSDLRKSCASGQDDLWRVMRSNLRLRLLGDKDGNCSLLGPQGCTMSKADRPRVCALYPSHYDLVGDHVVLKSDALADSSGCLALHECGGSEHKLYRLVSTTEKENQVLAEKAHLEANEHFQIGSVGVRVEIDKMERS